MERNRNVYMSVGPLWSPSKVSDQRAGVGRRRVHKDGVATEKNLNISMIVLFNMFYFSRRIIPIKNASLESCVGRQQHRFLRKLVVFIFNQNNPYTRVVAWLTQWRERKVVAATYARLTKTYSAPWHWFMQSWITVVYDRGRDGGAGIGGGGACSDMCVCVCVCVCVYECMLRWETVRPSVVTMVTV